MQLYVNAENIVYPIIVLISASDNDSELVWDESWPKNNEALTTILQNELGTTDNYTFYIAPSFRKKGSSHTNLLYLPITATAGEGGSITESGEKIFRPGAIDQTYTVTANAGYTISYILVDGTPVPNSFNCGEIAIFTFDAIYGPRTINAIFKKVEGNFTH